MRLRSIVIVLVLLLLVGLSVLNMGEVMRPTELNLGWRTVQAPLVLVLLVVAVLALLLAVASAAYDQTRHLKAQQAAEQEVQAQRRLADKAEGSRLAEVQRHLDLQAQAAQQRERELLGQLDEHFEHMQRALQRQTDDMGNSLAAYIGELEDRLERRRALRPVDLDERQPPPYPHS